jgi:ribokinase
MNPSSILVFGSINMDLVARVSRLPGPGETLLGDQFLTVPGGKGANQAVAASRLGIPTKMIGRVGGDEYGRTLLTGLQLALIDTSYISTDSEQSSGVAIITVDIRSENHIVVIPGANGSVNPSDVERLKEVLPQASLLLLQLEVPIPMVMQAAQVAQEMGVRVILDPAPASSEISQFLGLVDILTPNAVEAEQLVGFAIDKTTVAQAAQILQQRGAKTVVIKLGAQGAFCLTPEEKFFVPAFSVDAIDTVAAGDAFNAGLAVALAEGRSIREAVVWGAAAGALSATKIGAQSSLPDRATFDQFLSRATL